ncbi:hypothetical protein SLE2022_155030 [Rubroshorea leprosula]
MALLHPSLSRIPSFIHLPLLHHKAKRPTRIQPPVSKHNLSPQSASFYSNHDNSGSWLLRIEEAISERTRVENPLSNRSVRALPYGFPKVLNLLDFHVSELCKVYKSRHTPLRGSFIGGHICLDWLCRRDPIHPLVILRPLGRLCSNLLGDDNWSVVGKHIHDVIHFNEKFYAVDSSSRLFVWEELSLQLIKVIGPAMVVGDGIFQVTSDGNRNRILAYFHLVKSSGDLFLVYGKPNGISCCSYRRGHSSSMCERADFRFFKLNQVLRIFEEVNSIGDQVFFLGEDCSFSVSTRELTGLEPDCLCFVNDSAPFGINKFNIDCDGENLSDNKCIGVFKLSQRKGVPLASYPEYSKIFWPSLSWLQSCPSPSSSD